MLLPYILAAWLLTDPAPGASAHAPAPLSLTWEAPAGCPDAAAVTAAVEAQLGLPIAEVPGRVEAYGRVRARPGGEFELELRIAKTAEVRTLKARDCQTLAAAAAFSLTLILDPSLDPTVVEHEPEPGPAPSPSPPAPSGSRPTVPDGLMRVDGGIGLGILPGLGGTIGLIVGIERGLVRGELEGRYGWPRDDLLRGRADVGASVQAGTVAVRACGVPRVARLAFPLCGGLEGGALRADGFGLAPDRTTHRPLLSAQVSAALAVELGSRWALSLAAVGLVPILRPAVEVEGGGELHRVASVGVRALLGVEVRFGSHPEPARNRPPPNRPGPSGRRPPFSGETAVSSRPASRPRDGSWLRR